MSRYAEGTSVSPEKSRMEIEQTLTRYGADQFMYGWQEEGAMVAFRADGRHVKFLIQLPDKTADQFTLTPSQKKRRSADAAFAAWQQACRQRWRALALVIKAKLEAVEAGISTFEQEFLAQTMLPDGTTVGQWILPQVAKAYDTGRMPKLLPMPETVS